MENSIHTFANYSVLINVHYGPSRFYVSSIHTVCDQYRWSNQGVRWLPKNDPRIRKSYFQVDTPNGPSGEFVKHAYELLPPNSKCITWEMRRQQCHSHIEMQKALKGYTLGPVLHTAHRSVENECNQATLLQPIGNL